MKKEPKNLTEIHSLIRKSMADADGDWETAYKKVMWKLRNDNILSTSVGWLLIELAVKRLITEFTQNQRFNTWHKSSNVRLLESSPPSQAKCELIEGARLAAVDSLLLFPLRFGKPLGEARKPDIEREEKWYLKYSRSFGLRYRWFHLIAEKLSNNKTKVKTILDDNDLKLLQRRAVTGLIKLPRANGNIIRQIA